MNNENFKKGIILIALGLISPYIASFLSIGGLFGGNITLLSFGILLSLASRLVLIIGVIILLYSIIQNPKPKQTIYPNYDSKLNFSSKNKIHCIYCGSENTIYAKYCNNCGKELIH